MGVGVGTDGSLGLLGEGDTGVRLSWKSSAVFPPVLVLVVRDGVVYKVPPVPVKGVPLN